MTLKERSIAAERELRESVRDMEFQCEQGALIEHDCPAMFACSSLLVNNVPEFKKSADLIAEQRAEIERLSVDAERYRWLRVGLGRLDAAIDAARKEKP